MAAASLPSSPYVLTLMMGSPSVVTPASLTNAVNEGVKRLEDVVAGRVQALSEDEYRAASR